MFISFLSEQAGDFAVGVYVDIHGGGLFGQTGHGHDVAADDDHEACTGSAASVLLAAAL